MVLVEWLYFNVKVVFDGSVRSLENSLYLLFEYSIVIIFIWFLYLGFFVMGLFYVLCLLIIFIRYKCFENGYVNRNYMYYCWFL